MASKNSEYEPLMLTCGDCSSRYPGDPEEEGPEHHDEDCSLRNAFILTGTWEEP